MSTPRVLSNSRQTATFPRPPPPPLAARACVRAAATLFIACASAGGTGPIIVSSGRPTASPFTSCVPVAEPHRGVSERETGEGRGERERGASTDIGIHSDEADELHAEPFDGARLRSDVRRGRVRA